MMPEGNNGEEIAPPRRAVAERKESVSGRIPEVALKGGGWCDLKKGEGMEGTR